MIEAMLNQHQRKGEPVMRTVSAIPRYLAGVIFLVFGLDGFLNFIPCPHRDVLPDSSWEPCTRRITCG